MLHLVQISYFLNVPNNPNPAHLCIPSTFLLLNQYKKLYDQPKINKLIKVSGEADKNRVIRGITNKAGIIKSRVGELEMVLAS